MAENTSSSSNPPFTDILKQLAFESPDEIAKKETGLKISQKIYLDQTGQTNNLNFFAARAVRWAEIEKWVLGKQDMTQFLPYMNVSDANKAYVQIDMTPIMVLPQFIGTLVESMAKNEEYPCVEAIDEDSVDEKAQRQLDALFRMHEVETINEIQQQAGIQLEPTNAYVPDNELSAQVYFELEDRLPKVIRFEKKLEGVLIDNQYERVLKRRMLHDNITFNMECTKIEKEGQAYNIRKCVPRNVFYSFFMSDTGRSEIGYIGECYNLKVRDIRSKWGVSPSNPTGLTEKEIYDLAKAASTQTPLLNFAHLWGQQYTTFNNNTPWDEVSIYVIDYEIKVIAKDYYVSKVDSYGKENIAPKKTKPEPKSENARVIEKKKEKIYRGVYAPYGHTQIYWGVPDLSMVEPLFTYSINIPNNTGEYIPSLAERALEPVREYALTKLKRKQLIAKLRPTGIRIDVESARNVLTGTGAVMEWEEIVRIYDQTGTELWSSKGLNPLEQTQPAFSQTAHDDTLNNIVQLSQLLLSIEAELRVLLGVPPYRDGSDVGERTSGVLQEQQNTSSFNVTDFIQNAHNQVMEETLYKVCLLSWQDVVKDKKESSDDLINTRFKVTVKMKQTAYEKQLLENNIQIAMKTIDPSTGKPLLSFKDAYAIRNINNSRLAEMYLANKTEENERKAEADKSKREEANIKSQQQSAQLAAEAEDKMQEKKMASEKEMIDFQTTKQKELELLKGIFMIASKGETPQMPDYFLPAIQQLVPNITIPLVQENKQMQQAMQMEAMQEQQEAMQGQQEQQGQEMPQEQMEQQPM